MLKKSLMSTLVVAALALGAGAARAEYTEYAKDAFPAAMQAVEKSGLNVVRQFEAFGGLHGWVLRDRSSGSHTLVYTTENGEAVIAGMVIDANGTNLTANYAAQYLPKDEAGQAAQAQAKAKAEQQAQKARPAAQEANQAEAYKAFTTEAASVVVGSNKNAPEVTVLFDPNCGYCKVMHKLLAPSVAAGEIRVRYVPVAILGGDSPQKAAAILSAKKPQSAIEDAVNGGLMGVSDTELNAKIAANTLLMRKYGFQGTPAVLYKEQGKDKAKTTIMVSEGVPTLSIFFAALGVSGQLDKLKADPQLARFLR